MRYGTRIFVMAAAISAMAGCNRIGNPFAGHEPIAKVGDKELYVSDIGSLFTPGITPQDSVKLLESYVDVWVKKQLKIEQAEKVFSSSSRDIDEMVADYRSSLLSHKLDQYYIDRKIDTLITPQAVAEYYAAHQSDFLLDRTIVKGAVVKLPDNFRQRKKIEELMSGSGERYQDFVEMSIKNGFVLKEFTSWSDLGDLTAMLPPAREGSYSELLVPQRIAEIKDGKDIYYVKIEARLDAGAPAPLERVTEAIRQVLFTQRKQEIVKAYEDSLYKAASDLDRVEINVIPLLPDTTEL